MSEFADAYTKLFEAFYQSHNNEQELMDTKTHLEQNLKEAVETINSYDKYINQDSTTIRDLETQLTHSKQLTDDAHSREQQAQEIIENMRTQILKLNNELELKSRLGGDEDDERGELSKTKEGFEREKQRMIDEITSLKQKLTNALSYSEELEYKNSVANLKSAELNIVLEQQINEGSKKQRQIEKLDSEIVDLHNQIDILQKKLDESKEVYEACQKQISLTEMHLKDQKTATEKAVKNAEMATVKMEKYQMELEIANLELADLKEKHSALNTSFKITNEENNKLKIDISKITKQKENLEKKLCLVEKFKFNIEQDRDKIKTNILVMEREIVLSKRQSESDRKQIDALSKEKEVIQKHLMRVQGAIEGHMKLIKIQEQSKRKLEGDINNYNNELVAHRKAMNKLEKERNKALEESFDLQQQVEDALDDVKIKQQSIYDYKKIIAELETKLRQQQNLFEAVRADRNSFQKQVQEVTSEVSELKTKLKISMHQSQQLKEDISAKEALLLKEENVLRKMNKEKENLKIEVQNGLFQIQKLKHEVAEFRQNEKILKKSIQENDAIIAKHGKQFEEIMNDRDVLGAQLVRRNDEIGLLTEKINILETTLNRGKIEYDQRIEDIKLLKLEIKRLQQEKNFLSKSIANMTNLKHEVFTLERELAQERLKCRALEEELQHPMNIHRWRKLEGSDPHVVDLLKKIQILQKRLLNQTSESIEREKQLKESEKLYLSLRHMLARQPGPNVKEELTKTQRALTLRGNKMKCLISELNMYENQALEYKMDVDKISKELKDTKKKYFKQKKLCESHLSNNMKLPAVQPTTSETSQQSETKFTGGGFKMSQ